MTDAPYPVDLAAAVLRQNIGKPGPWSFDEQGAAVVRQALDVVLADATRAESRSTPDREGVARIILGKSSSWNSPSCADWRLSEWLQYPHVQLALAKADAILALARPASSAGGGLEEDHSAPVLRTSELGSPSHRTDGTGEPSSGENQIGAAEREVGQYVYRRIEALMDTGKLGTADGAELCYLAAIAESVEEYGIENCGGGSLSPFPSPAPAPSIPAGWVEGVTWRNDPAEEARLRKIAKTAFSTPGATQEQVLDEIARCEARIAAGDFTPFCFYDSRTREERFASLIDAASGRLGAKGDITVGDAKQLAADLTALAAAPSPVVEGGDQGSKSCAFQLASGNSPSPSTDGPAGTWRAVGRVTLSHIPSGARYTFWDGQTIKAVEPASAEAAERLSAILAGKDPDDAQGVTGGAE